MNVKILKKALIVLLIGSILSGCTTKIEYVDRAIEVKVPQKCIIPEIQIDLNKQTYTEKVEILEIYIYELEEAIKVCK